MLGSPNSHLQNHLQNPNGGGQQLNLVSGHGQGLVGLHHHGGHGPHGHGLPVASPLPEPTYVSL